MGPEIEFKVGDLVTHGTPSTVRYRVTAIGEKCLLVASLKTGKEYMLAGRNVTKAPDTKEYVITTEHRLPTAGETYVGTYGGNDTTRCPLGLFTPSQGYRFTACDVVTGVRPL